MDPLSITAACSSLAFAIVRNGRALATVFEKYQTAQHSIFMIQTECTVLAAALSQLESSITGQKASRLKRCPPSALEALDLSLTGCTLTLSVLEKEINRLTDGVGDAALKMGKADRAKYVWKEESMNELLQQLRGQSSALTLLLKALDSTSIEQILSIVKSGQPTLHKVRRGAASIRSAYPEENYAESILDMPFDDSKTIYSLEMPELDEEWTEVSHETTSLVNTEGPRQEQHESLPWGWEKCYSVEHSQWYYVNTATRKSQWEYPSNSPSPHPRPQQSKPEQQRLTRKPVNAKQNQQAVADSTLVTESLDLTPWAMNSPSKLEDHLDSLRKGHGVAAVAVGIVSVKGPPELFVRGYRRIDRQIPVTRSDKWPLPFTIDTMTYSVLAMIIDRGLLSWEDKIVSLLPSLSGQVHPFHRETTLAMLASHRSGFAINIYDAENGDLWRYLSGTETSAKQGRFAVAASYLIRPPDHAPGTNFSWQAANSVLVALALEVVTNQPFEHLLKTLIFDPLEMYSTGFGWPDMARNDSRTPTQPWGHDSDTKQPVDILPSRGLNVKAVYSMQGVHCSAADYAAYLQFQLRCAMGLDTAGLLSKDAISRRNAPVGSNGLGYNCDGWNLCERDWANGLTLNLSGHGHGASNCAWIAPLTGKAYFVFSNIDGGIGSKFTDEAVAAAIRYDTAKK